MSELDENLVKFMEGRKLMAIATVDESGKPWICNVYYSTDDKLNIYFVSSRDTTHSKHVEQESEVAFSMSWYDENNLGNRKAIQGKGNMELVKDMPTILAALKHHHKKYPDWKDVINWENMRKNVIKSRLYKIVPSYMKYWDDELYDEEGTREFKFG